MPDQTETVNLKQAVTDSPRHAETVSLRQGALDGLGDDYDPHLHRSVEKPTNNFETLIHLLKCSLGTGILAMPQAFARAGLVTGIVSTIIIAILITHCLHILVKAQYNLCKIKRVPLLTYPESMTTAFEIGPSSLRRCAYHSALLVDWFLVVYQLGICCCYTVFIASNFKQLADPYYPMSLYVWMLIVLGPLVLMNLIPNLKMLAPFSTVANVLTLLGLGIIVYYLFALDKKSTSTMDLWGSYATFPLFFGTVLFALTAVGVVIALENNMQKPKDFGKPFGVLNIGMAIVTLLYIGIGVIGYHFCVDKCSDSITQDLPSADWPTQVLMVFYAIAILISYALQCYVPVDILWNTYLKPCLQKRGRTSLMPFEYLLRVMLCVLTFLLAAAVPRLGLFISLFGALCLSALGMIFPALLEIFIAMQTKLSKLLLTKNIILIIIGLVGMVAGTYASLLEMINSFK